MLWMINTIQLNGSKGLENANNELDHLMDEVGELYFEGDEFLASAETGAQAKAAQKEYPTLHLFIYFSHCLTQN